MHALKLYGPRTGRQNSYGAARSPCGPREWTYDFCSNQPGNSRYGARECDVTGALLALCAGNSPLTSEFPSQQWHGALMFSLICAWLNGWVNNRGAGDLRRHRADYDIIVMNLSSSIYHYWWWGEGRATTTIWEPNCDGPCLNLIIYVLCHEIVFSI